MATFAMTGVDDRWPNTTTVSVFARNPFGQATGSAVTTADVSSGAVTFTGLADATEYVASGNSRSVSFRTSAASVSAEAAADPDYMPHDVSGTAGRGNLPAGVKMANISRTATELTNQATSSSGTLRLSPLGVLRAGDSLSFVKFSSSTQAAVTPTNQWACLVRASDLQVMAVSADKLTEAWAASNGKKFDFVTPYSPASDEFVLAGVMVAAGTIPSFLGITHATTIVFNSNATVGFAPVTNGDSTSSLTSPLAVGATASAITLNARVVACWAG